MSRREPKELRRIVVGFQVLGGMNSPNSFHLLYRIDYEDGSTKMDRGLAVYTLPGMMEVGQKMPANVRADLAPHMRAIQELLPPLEHACLMLDGRLKLPKKTKRKRPRRRDNGDK